jgi:hypothetical protein
MRHVDWRPRRWRDGGGGKKHNETRCKDWSRVGGFGQEVDFYPEDVRLLETTDGPVAWNCNSEEFVLISGGR